MIKISAKTTEADNVMAISKGIKYDNKLAANNNSAAALTTDAMVFKPKAMAKYRRPIPKYPC